MLTIQSAVPSSTTNIRLRFYSASTKFNYIAQRTWLSVTLIGIIAFLGSAAVGLIAGIREPKVHDEFSSLLAGDTFAQGRLTNPTHPMWVHFETFHIIHEPTYMSKYPPAQGLVLAAGQIIGGHPIVGVWMSFGLMCAAICWMLHAWVPPRWASLGGVLAIINPALGIAGYWAQSYWGGALAATGGALVLGGVRRLARQPRVEVSLLTGIGLAILANSRPFEGLLVGLTAAIVLSRHIMNRRGRAIGISIKRILVPITLVLAVTSAGMALYNLRITGSPLRMPYQIHEATYAMAPVFLWQKLPPKPDYRHSVIHDFHATFALSLYTTQRSISGFLTKDLYQLLWLVVRALNIFLIPVIVTLPLLIEWMVRDPWPRNALLIYFVLVLGLLTETFKYVHYLAPVMGFHYYFVLNAFRLLRWYNKRAGIVALQLTLSLAVLAISLFATIRQEESSSSSHIRRAELLKRLQQDEGEHLIIVSYTSGHSGHNEWVYNESNIDRAKVVFARAMNSKQDCQLVEYFKARRIWSLEVDGEQLTPQLTPYPISQCR
jgi:hypothetical protein